MVAAGLNMGVSSFLLDAGLELVADSVMCNAIMTSVPASVVLVADKDLVVASTELLPGLEELAAPVVEVVAMMVVSAPMEVAPGVEDHLTGLSWSDCLWIHNRVSEQKRWIPAL